jgi:hypothetical protein
MIVDVDIDINPANHVAAIVMATGEPDAMVENRVRERSAGCPHESLVTLNWVPSVAVVVIIF